MKDAHLSKRQTEVLELLSQGLTQKQVAASLGIEYSTVQHYAKGIFQKLGAHTLVQALRTAFKQKIIRI